MRDLSQGPNKVVAPVGTPLSPENKFVPLKDLHKEEIRAYLSHFATALRLADQAARYDHCDWEMPPITLQDFDFPLEDIQRLRTVAGLLSTRYMLELSEHRFDDALRTLQTGFALARDLGKGDTLIQDLVGIAVGSIMFGHVQQWEEIPGSPNLFWALTDLPAPLVNPAPAMRSELTILYRSFPPLREVLRRSDKGALSEEETNRIVAELTKDWGAYVGQEMPDWQRKLAAAALVLKTYPDAKKYLKEQGRTDEQVDSMPAAQVVLLYFVEQYDEIKDDFLKWMNVPPWQARAGLMEAVKEVRALGPNGNPDHRPDDAGRGEGVRGPHSHRVHGRLPALRRGDPPLRRDPRRQGAGEAGGRETAAARRPIHRRRLRQVLQGGQGRRGRVRDSAASAVHAAVDGSALRAGPAQVNYLFRRLVMMKYALAVLAASAVALPATAADRKLDAEACAKAVAPFLDDSTFAVLHVDLTAVDVNALVAKAAALARTGAGRTAPAQEKPPADVKALNGAGARDLYLVFSLADVPERSPFLVVPMEKERVKASLKPRRYSPRFLSAVRWSGSATPWWAATKRRSSGCGPQAGGQAGVGQGVRRGRRRRGAAGRLSPQGRGQDH